MAAPSLTEEAKLLNLGLIAHYQKHRNWYVQQARALVAHARLVVTIVSNTNNGAVHTFTQDEIGQMLNLWLRNNQQWQNLLARKPHLSLSQYDLITDSMARYIAWNDYSAIIV